MNRRTLIAGALATMVATQIGTTGTADAAGTDSYGAQSGQQVKHYAGGRGWVMVIHGGSWASGTIDAEERASRILQAAGLTVFSIDYRKVVDYQSKPGVPFRDQIQDCLDAWDWIRDHAATFNIDPGRGAVYGYSAGGHLAAHVAGRRTTVNGCVTVCAPLEPDRIVLVAESTSGYGIDKPTTSNKGLAVMAAIAVRCPRATTNPDWAAAWADFNPATYIRRTSLRFMTISGMSDPTVPSGTGWGFHNMLLKRGIPSILYQVVGGRHTESLGMDGGIRQRRIISHLQSVTA